MKYLLLVIILFTASCNNGYEKGKKEQFAADTAAIKELIEENAKLKKEKETRDFIDSIINNKIEIPQTDTTVMNIDSKLIPPPALDTSIY